MVRLLRRQQQRVPSLSPTTTPTLAPPRVRMCVSWRYVFTGVLVVYAVGLVVVMLTLDRLDSVSSRSERRRNQNPNYHNPMNLIPLDISSFVQNVRDKVQDLEDEILQMDALEFVNRIRNEAVQLENHFMAWAWKGWENAKEAMPYEEVELLSLPVDILRIQGMEEYLQKMHPEKELKLCRRLGNATDLTRTTKATMNPACFQFKPLPQYTTDILASCHHHDPQKRYYVYNPLEHSRVVCSMKVPARGLMEIPAEMWDSALSSSSSSLESCLHSAHLYPVLPNVTGAGLKPIRLLDNVESDEAESHDEACDVPCRCSGFDNLITHRRIAGTPFDFTFSMEGPEYYSEVKVKPDAWQHNKFFATTDFNSDIPLPYFSFAEYDIQHGHEPVAYDEVIKGALFLARNCASKNDREALVQQLLDLSHIFRVDSLSDCLQNAEPPRGVSLSDKTKLMRQYMFYMALENQNAHDYISEKLWGAFVAGVIPIYLGTPNIKDHVPDNSVIAVNDFKTPEALAKHLHEVASDRFLYESYHAWRNEPLPEHFMKKYNITKTHNKCRTCRWALAKRYGLGWSHQRQFVVDLQIPRQACRDKDGLLSWPVREYWFQSEANDNSTQPISSEAKPVLCVPTKTLPWTAHTTIAGRWERIVHEHDGVIDLQVRPRGSHLETDDTASEQRPLVLELMFPFGEKDGEVKYRRAGPGHLEWQNQTARVTLLFEPANRTPIRRPTATTIQLIQPRALRIIVEDVDLFHKGASEKQNYFASTMKRDWDTPLEVLVGK